MPRPNEKSDLNSYLKHKFHKNLQILTFYFGKNLQILTFYFGKNLQILTFYEIIWMRM